MKVELKTYSVITGTGSFVPPVIVDNSHFANNLFMNTDGSIIETPAQEIAERFEQITDIKERRLAEPHHNTSDLATFAAEEALADAGIDPEMLDYIIVAHNLGDINPENGYCDIVPTLASRVKYNLGIRNPKAIAYDTTFGCPGWTQAMIQADYYIRSGDAKSALVIGADVLSRAMDPHDRDAMIFSDGAAAVVLEARESETPVGMLKHSARSDALEYLEILKMGRSFNASNNRDALYLKMMGRRVYNYGLTYVPDLVKECLDKNDLTLTDIKKVLIHQANAKMDEAILKRLFKLYGMKDVDMSVMPMIIRTFGNSSAATVPTLCDLVFKGKLSGHVVESGDNVVMTSVGAGMNINAFVYRMP
ncbi:MAG: ketoacyl-ACP synthase III [Cytophagaceae bacterium]|jgi:3-oxoacyl-[acyl-carrier-protein] synthase-3|nr:ketoacyl-ACP synthase III [Cytophagaceae bacterium]